MFLLLHYIPDEIDLFTAPRSFMYNVEDLFCTEDSITKLFGMIHSHRDEPAEHVPEAYTAWYKCNLLHRENDLPAYIMYNDEHVVDDQKWYWRGNLHRENDMPAVVTPNEQSWYQHGEEYRQYGKPFRISFGDKYYNEGQDKTRVEYKDGSVAWYIDDSLHREDDLPALIESNGNKTWALCGDYHRANDLPARIYANGDQEWYMCGKRHRDNDKPAVIKEDTMEWWICGRLHRDNDKPAIVKKGCFGMVDQRPTPTVKMSQ